MCESPLGAGVLLERKRVILVPHTGQVPWAIVRPLAVSLIVASLAVRVVRHLTQ